MPPKKSKRELRKFDLPVEVWARVAADMSLREWAKASGTCRSTRAVRLKNLTIKNTPAAGVQWASRMMDGVEALCLSLQSLQQVAQGIARGLYSIKHLQQLILDTPVPSDVALPACLPWLLAQASKLEVLVTPGGTRPWFPPLATLKHLDLRFHSDAGNIYEAVLSCTGLETLSLHCQARTGRTLHADFGPLELGNLPHLRVVVLKAINPNTISVPKACQLHIGASANPDMQNSVWHRVLANIHGIDVKLTHPDPTALDFFLSKTMNPLQSLRILSIEVYSLGHLNTTLLDLKGFAQVEKLRISGSALALRFPAGVCWDNVEVVAKQRLVLDFEDLGGFTQAVHCFSASYGHLCSTQALELCTALAMQGIRCAFRKEEQGISMFWFPAAVGPSGCFCGACLDCLVASGQAVANAGEAELPRFPEPPHGLPVGHFYGGHMADQEVDMYGEDDLPDLGDEDEDEDDEEEEDYGW